MMVLVAAGGAVLVAGAVLASRGPFDNRSMNGLLSVVWMYARLWHGLRVRGVANVPAAGPVIIAANHTTGLDPVLLQAGCPRLIRWVMLTSWRFRLLEPIWRRVQPICLDRGTRDVAGIRAIVRVLEQGEAVGLFPEGGLQREARALNPFHPGIAMIARRSDAPIVPAWIEGTPRRRNMLWHFLQPSRSRVTFGQPYRPPASWSRQQILDDLRQRMENLRLATGQWERVTWQRTR